MASGAADAIVIGAGIIGCAVALELAREGRAVTVVDARPTAGAGTTGASSGIVRFHCSSLDGVAAAWEACQWWTRWAEHLGVPDDRGSAHYLRTGGIVLDTADADHSDVLRRFDAVGVPYEELTADQIRDRFPAVDPCAYGPPALVGEAGFWRPAHGELRGIYTPDAGYVDDPQLAAHNLMTAARYHGARFRFGETVTMIRRTADRVAGVRLASGRTIDAPVVVNVAGPTSDAVNRLADVTTDMRVRGRPLRVETHAIPAPCGFGLDGGGVFVTDHDLGSAFRPQAGGYVHISSIEPECDPLDWASDPETYYHAPTAAIYERQAYRVARRLPGLTVPLRPSGLAALYDVTPDWTPVFDRTTLPGFYAASGTSGKSFSLAPAAGPMIAALIRACESGHDHDRFPVQYACRAIPATVDLGVYSRRRVPVGRRPANVLG